MLNDVPFHSTGKRPRTEKNIALNFMVSGNDAGWLRVSCPKIPWEDLHTPYDSCLEYLTHDTRAKVRVQGSTEGCIVKFTALLDLGSPGRDSHGRHGSGASSQLMQDVAMTNQQFMAQVP